MAHSHIYPKFTGKVASPTHFPANRKVDQSLSEFQTGIDAATHATLDMKQLISHIRVALVDTISSLPDLEGGVIPVSEVGELLIKVHDILDNAVSNGFGNSACILVHVFNSLFRQHHDVWASLFPFLPSLKDMVLASEACLYGHINLSLAQAQQQSSVDLSVFFPMRSGKARPRTGFNFSMQGDLCQSSNASLSKRAHLESTIEVV